MTFGPLKVGGWSLNDTVTSAQLNDLNTKIQQALDGANGGPYNPAAVLLIGGEGIDHVYLADTAALKAINTTSVADGSVRWVAGLGRYVLDKTLYPTFTEDLPMCVAPTTGTGRWFSADPAATLKYVRTFTATGASSWKCPPNLTLALVEVVGGGGGGGAGQGSSSASHDCVGGPGGGSGQRVLAVVAPVGNASHDVTVGAGGGGGSGGTPGGGAGGDGVASSLQVHLGLLLASANGGAGVSADFTVSSTAILRLGGKRANAGVFSSPVLLASAFTSWPVDQGDGGFAANNVTAGSSGGYSDTGFAGGSGAAAGTTSTNKGGSGGAGGAGGAGGNGGNGGAGGNGTAGAAGSPQNGTAGAAAAANTGAGGGGGGGAGAAASGSAAGGNGGAGGSGYVIIRGHA